jgi:hypothetical protein
MRRIGYRLPLGLMMRPAPRIIRELPPSLAAYRVQVFFQAAPDAAPTARGVRVRVGETEKPLAAASSGSPLPRVDA